VTAASPAAAAQGTSNLNVTIGAKSRKAGAQVTFYRTGADGAQNRKV
jgi:N-methylhydantoinase B/oxoprolinase/acetone carboxylase alpha subunit